MLDDRIVILSKCTFQNEMFLLYVLLCLLCTYKWAYHGCMVVLVELYDGTFPLSSYYHIISIYIEIAVFLLEMVISCGLNMASNMTTL
jgi:hypothetical protein